MAPARDVHRGRSSRFLVNQTIGAYLALNMEAGNYGNVCPILGKSLTIEFLCGVPATGSRDMMLSRKPG